MLCPSIEALRIQKAYKMLNSKVRTLLSFLVLVSLALVSLLFYFCLALVCCWFCFCLACLFFVFV